MRSDYITYFEGLNNEGVVIYSGNHSNYIEYSNFPESSGYLESTVGHLLIQAKEFNPLVTRIVIKGIWKL